MFAVNMFGNNDCYWNTKPTYYVLIDPSFFRITAIDKVERQKEQFV